MRAGQSKNQPASMQASKEAPRSAATAWKTAVLNSSSAGTEKLVGTPTLAPAPWANRSSAVRSTAGASSEKRLCGSSSSSRKLSWPCSPELMRTLLATSWMPVPARNPATTCAGM
jgi:hypothetical protein